MSHKKSISQGYIWNKMYMSLKYIKHDKKKNTFIPKVIVRKKEDKFINNPKKIG